MSAGGLSNMGKSKKINKNYALDGAYNEFSDNLTDEMYADLLNKTLRNCLSFSDDVLFNIGILSHSKNGIIQMLNDFKQNFCDIVVWNKNNSMICQGIDSMKGFLSHRCELLFCFNQKGTRNFTHPQWENGMFNGEIAINRIDSKNSSNNEYAKVHKATFPVEFAAEILKRFCNESVLDCFGGTGTTMIAAEQLGRKSFLSELDPLYCDIIIARWEKFTGQKAELISNNLIA